MGLARRIGACAGRRKGSVIGYHRPPVTNTTASGKPPYWDTATRALARADPALRRLILAHPEIHLRRRGDPFTTLARAIVGQQISVKAADSVWKRFVVASGGSPRTRFPRLDPLRVTALGPDGMRLCGFSGRKAEYVGHLAASFSTGAIDPRRFRLLDDEALIGTLTALKGIGRWTAEMYLIFHELRPDILPVDDLGLQKAMALAYNNGEKLAIDAMRTLALRWQPWRSVATWYLWRSLDPIPVEY